MPVFTLLCGIAAAWWSAQVRRQARLERALELMRKSPTALSHDYDPIALVRAVNHLHALGKADSLEVLRRFAKDNPNDGSPTAPHQSLELVVLLLFDRTSRDDSFPTADWNDPLGSFRWTTSDPWPTWITIHDDIPFHCASGMGFSGNWPDLTYFIHWADQHAHMRPAPLLPANDPLSAADELLEQLTNGEEWNEERTPFEARHLRQQAFQAIAHLLPPNQRDESSWEYFKDEAWSRLKETCGKLGIQWSEVRQEYVAHSVDLKRN